MASHCGVGSRGISDKWTLNIEDALAWTPHRIRSAISVMTNMHLKAE